MTEPILRISDGTTTIDLIQKGGNAVFLNSWRPQIAGFKGGGVWNESSLSDGRRMVHSQWENVIETFDLKLRREDADMLYRDLDALRNLLIKAVQYWTEDWQDEPVWIEARASCETNSRYAVIYSFDTPEDENPFAQPFLQPQGAAVADNFTLSLERGHWLGNEPGTGTCFKTATLATVRIVETEFAVSIAQSSDDCWSMLGGASFSLVETTPDIGYNVTDSCLNGLRFQNVTVPQGTTIKKAWITFHAALTDAGAGADSLITGEDISSAATFFNFADYSARPRTSASACWGCGDNTYGIADWTQNNYYDSPDIASVVQEIVNRTDWASGNAMAFFIEDFDSTPGQFRTFGSWDNVTYDPPELHILYDTTTVISGTAPTCDDIVFFGNKDNDASLTHIYRFDTVLGWSPNWVDEDGGFSIFGAALAIGDAIYFGVTTANEVSGPFCSLVFNIETIGNGYNTYWEYWSGAAWSTLSVRDNTSIARVGLFAFTESGYNVVSWAHPTNWATVNLATNPGGFGAPNVTGYWVRCRVDTIPRLPLIPPWQGDGIVYTITWSSAEVDGDDLSGTIAALGQLIVTNLSGATPSLPYIANGWTNRLVVGTRATDRGADFRAFLNLAPIAPNAQLPIGIDLSLGTNVSQTADIASATGYRLTYNPAAAIAQEGLLALEFDESIAYQFYGTYHAYMRVVQSGGAAGDFAIQLLISTGDDYYTERTKWSYTYRTTDWNVLDFGRVTLPTSTNKLLMDEEYTFHIDVLGKALSGTPNLYLYDLILIPADEWIADCSSPWNTGLQSQAARAEMYMDIDSLTVPRAMIRTVVKSRETGFWRHLWQSIASGPVTFLPKKTQKIWFFASARAVTALPPFSYPYPVHSVQAFYTNRYLGGRGNL